MTSDKASPAQDGFLRGTTVDEMLAHLCVEDPSARLELVQKAVCPVLRDLTLRTARDLDGVYGSTWRELLTETIRPAPRDAAKTKATWDYADVGLLPSRAPAGAYRLRSLAGRPVRFMVSRLTYLANRHEIRVQFAVWAHREVELFEGLWLDQRNEVLALLDTIDCTIDADVPVPGPPFVTRAEAIDNALRSRPDYVWIYGPAVGPGTDPQWAVERLTFGFVVLFPLLVSLAELALGRAASLRAMRAALCKAIGSDEPEGVEAQETRMSSRLRYRVLERDGFRCVMCGATAATGAVLQADHILPASKGGRTHLDNLQTLCDRCNRGKGAQVSPDLRIRD